jgi:hypothetical protein
MKENNLETVTSLSSDLSTRENITNIAGISISIIKEK